MDEALKDRTRKTAQHALPHRQGRGGVRHWKKFDKELARELSLFFTGKLYSREVISQKQRELCAVASLTVLNRRNELRAHIHAALNVGATRQEVAEVVFQQVTYGGMPVVVEALAVFKEVLEERGEWAGGAPSRSPSDPSHRRRRHRGRARGGRGRAAVLPRRLRGHHQARPDPGDPGGPRGRDGHHRECSAAPSPRRLPRGGVRRSRAHRPPLDHRSHRRDEELRPPHSDVGGADRARRAGRGHRRGSAEPVSRRALLGAPGRRRLGQRRRLHVSDVATLPEAFLLHSSLPLLRPTPYWDRLRPAGRRAPRGPAASATTTATAWWRRARPRSTWRSTSSPGTWRR